MCVLCKLRHIQKCFTICKSYTMCFSVIFRQEIVVAVMAA